MIRASRSLRGLAPRTGVSAISGGSRDSDTRSRIVRGRVPKAASLASDGLRSSRELARNGLFDHVDEVDALAAVAVLPMACIGMRLAKPTLRARRLAPADGHRGGLVFLKSKRSARQVRDRRMCGCGSREARKLLPTGLDESLDPAPQHLRSGWHRLHGSRLAAECRPATLRVGRPLLTARTDHASRRCRCPGIGESGARSAVPKIARTWPGSSGSRPCRCCETPAAGPMQDVFNELAGVHPILRLGAHWRTGVRDGA